MAARPEDPVELLIAANEAQAQVVIGVLEEAGIPARQHITNLGFGMGGEMPLSGLGPRAVLVRRDQLEPARRALDAATDDAAT